MSFLDWDESVALAEATNERFRGLIYLAVDSGMRWSELVGLRRARLEVRRCKVRVTEQLIRLTPVQVCVGIWMCGQERERRGAGDDAVGYGLAR